MTKRQKKKKRPELTVRAQKLSHLRIQEEIWRSELRRIK